MNSIRKLKSENPSIVKR